MGEALAQDDFKLTQTRHCERSEAIQENLGASRLLDRRVAIARPEGRASLDALRLLAMTTTVQPKGVML